MPSDRSRTSDDLRQHYHAVVTQQGRVILDRDFNALQGIVGGQIVADALDEIGPCGSPDEGFAISLPPASLPASVSVSFSRPSLWDFLISPGTMYVGGQRVVLEVPRPTQPAWSYFHQPDWLFPDDPTAVGSVSFSTPGHESVYLRVFEQEVGAVEDPDLLDVALGGPDTTQRVRLMKRVERLAVAGTDCASALKEVRADWLAQGFAFDPATMRLAPQVKLQVSFGAATATANPCDPVAQGGYLGAENQLLRVQIAEPIAKGQARLLWGYDNASFLYRVSVQPDGLTLLLNQTPVDAFHSPKPGQIVEVLRTAAILGGVDPGPGATGQPPITRCVANATGHVATVGAFNNGDTLVLTTSLPAAYRTDTNQLFLRVWQGLQTFDPSLNQPITLTNPTGQTSPGVQVTITSPGIGAALPVGAFWMFALRPSTPQAVYPQRYLAEPQPPDGPRQWLCPLAVITWGFHASASVSTPAFSGVDAVIADCRQHFDNLVKLTKRASGDGVTVTGVLATGGDRQDVVVHNGDTLTGSILSRGLRVLLNGAVEPGSATPAACFVTLGLPFTTATAFTGLQPGFQNNLAIGYQNIVLGAAVSATNPSVLNWAPEQGSQNFLVRRFPSNDPIGFGLDWDILSGTVSVSWQYNLGRAQANVTANPVPGATFEGGVINQRPVMDKALTLQATANMPDKLSEIVVQYTGVIFNYISANDFWVYRIGFDFSSMRVDILHFKNGVIAKLPNGTPEGSSSTNRPLGWVPVSIDFTISANASGGELGFGYGLRGPSGQTSGGGQAFGGAPGHIPVVPTALTPGSQVGLHTSWAGTTDFTALEVDYASGEHQLLLPPRLPAQLTVKRNFLRPAGSSASGTAVAPILPDFTMWFWVQPSHLRFIIIPPIIDIPIRNLG